MKGEGKNEWLKAFESMIMLNDIKYDMNLNICKLNDLIELETYFTIFIWINHKKKVELGIIFGLGH